MPVSVVVGGQFGSEGKGKVAFLIARNMEAVAAVRVGGSNSGHTVISDSGQPVILRHLPTAALLPRVTCILGAGSYIDVDVLFREIEMTGIPAKRLMIDPNAMVVTEADKKEELSRALNDRIGSTLSGTGAAVARRVLRADSDCLAGSDPRLAPYVRPVVPFMREQLSFGCRIIIEGTQGFGLSNLHSPYFPCATSRDTTAAGFISEAGLSPLDVDDVVLVLRAFPIRVLGNSGPLPYEIDWEIVSRESGSPFELMELTSVTRKARRVARFHPDIARRAIEVNAPTRVVLNHLDYVAQPERSAFLQRAEEQIGQSVDYCGFGPDSVTVRGSVSCF